MRKSDHQMVMKVFLIKLDNHRIQSLHIFEPIKTHQNSRAIFKKNVLHSSKSSKIKLFEDYKSMAI